MKNTADRILAAALGLFNEKGLSQVTLRTISRKMGISQGNLNYHFKKREEIIERLYFNLVENIDIELLGPPHEEKGLKFLLDLSNSITDNFYHHRFFLLDFVQVMRESRTIKTHYLKLSKIREKQFSELFGSLMKKGILRKEILPNEYAFLYRRFQIIGDFWLSSAQVTHARITRKMINEYSEIINQSIYPYLTEKGRAAYHVYCGSVK